MTNVIGLDLSLTGTGVAFIDDTGIMYDGNGDQAHAPSGEPYHFGRTIATKTVSSSGKKDATLEARADRLVVLLERIRRECTGAQLVCVEGPSLAQKSQAGQHDRAGLWWLVVNTLITEGFIVVEVSPSSLKKYATGKGNASKDAVLAAVIRRYIDVAEPADNNQADALVLAAMGRRWLGTPVETHMPQVNLDAMTKVHWPVAVTSA